MALTSYHAGVTYLHNWFIEDQLQMSRYTVNKIKSNEKRENLASPSAMEKKEIQESIFGIRRMYWTS